MTEYAVQSKSDNHADAAKPISIWIYGQLSEQRYKCSTVACLTPIPETSGFASIDKDGLDSLIKQLMRVGRVHLAAM